MSDLSSTSEDSLIAHLTEKLGTTPEVIVGVGDDCAVIKRSEDAHTLLKTDTVVESVHFKPREIPQRVGWKAAARVISDFAAMGGKPEALLVTIILPAETELEWIEAVYEGLRACAKNHRCAIVGGETSSAPAGSPRIISISGTGTVKPHNLTLRSGGSSGDLLYVTGLLGGSIRGKHLDFTPRIKESTWLTSYFKPTTMMDLSDGLAKDLPRLAKASKCGFEIFPKQIPRNKGYTVEQALGDGEDYELLFSIPPESQAELENAWSKMFPDLKLSNIGHLTARPSDHLDGGWDHFQE